MTDAQTTEIEMLVNMAGLQLQCAIWTIDVIGQRWAAFGLPRHEVIGWSLERGRELQEVLEGFHAALASNPGEA